MSRKVDERAAIIARIRDDNRRGASELARDAVAALEHQIPFYVCAESFKLSANTAFSNEEHDPRELEATHPGIRPRNFYFESTPAGLISMYLSDIAIENEIELAPKRR